MANPDRSRMLPDQAQPVPPWVETMLSHIGDMEELKRQLKALNERLVEIRERGEPDGSGKGRDPEPFSSW